MGLKSGKSNTVATAPERQQAPEPTVTVVVPAYGVERYLGACIESVLAQTETKWQLVVVDDGSTDASGRIADEYASRDARIEVVHRENGGLSEARNSGIARARAPFITLLDGDDLLHPQCLETMLRLQEGHDDRITCVGHFDFPDGNPDALRRHIERHHMTTENLRSMTPESAMEEILYQRGLAHSAWGKLYPRHAIPAGIYTPGIGYEDLDSFYRIFPAVKEILYTTVPLYGYRDNPGSYLHRFTPRRADVLDVAEKLLHEIEGSYPRLVPAARSRLLSAYFNIYSLMTAAGYDDTSLACRCLGGIKRLRRGCLCDRKVRMKNRLGIAASYVGGAPLLRLLARIMY